jgi:homoserine dehydrogenase
MPVEEFLSRTGDLDEYFTVRVRSAQKHGRVLRYVAVIENGKCRVGPDEVVLETPLGRLRGNDNLIEIYTRLYDPHPLVIQGRGAGVPATAAGVLSDIIDLAIR